MNLSYAVKQNAKAALRGNSGVFRKIILLIAFICLAVDALDVAVFQILGYDFQAIAYDIYLYSPNFFYTEMALVVSVVLILVRMLFHLPLSLGLVNWCVETTDGNRNNTSYVFLPYENKMAGRSISLGINIFFKQVFAFLALMAPTIAFFMAANALRRYRVFLHVFNLLAIICFVIGCVIFLAFRQRYAITRILLCEKYGSTTHRSIVNSAKAMKGHKWELLMFKLSFLPMFIPLIAVFIFTQYFMLSNIITYAAGIITAIIGGPYYITSCILYERYLYELFEKNEKENLLVQEAKKASKEAVKEERRADTSAADFTEANELSDSEGTAETADSADSSEGDSGNE